MADCSRGDGDFQHGIVRWGEIEVPDLQVIGALALGAAGADAAAVDSSQDDSTIQHGIVRWITREHPDLQVVCGDVFTLRQATRFVECGEKALRVGMDVGPLCPKQEGAAGPEPGARSVLASAGRGPA